MCVARWVLRDARHSLRSLILSRSRNAAPGLGVTLMTTRVDVVSVLVWSARLRGRILESESTWVGRSGRHYVSVHLTILR